MFFFKDITSAAQDLTIAIDKRLENLKLELKNLKENKNSLNDEFNEQSNKINSLDVVYKNLVENIMKLDLKKCDSTSDEDDNDSDNDSRLNLTDSSNGSVDISDKISTNSEKINNFCNQSIDNSVDYLRFQINLNLNSSQKLSNDDYHELMNMLMKDLVIINDKSQNKRR